MNPSEFAYRIAICNDCLQDRERVANMTRQIMSDTGNTCNIAVFSHGKALLDTILGGTVYDILLLDVMMDGMDGMTLAAALREQGQQSAIVFISSNREMAMCGYEVAALQYCIEQTESKKEILLSTEQGHHRISLRNIQYVEAYERGTRFILSDKVLSSRLKLGQAQALLPYSTSTRPPYFEAMPSMIFRPKPCFGTVFLRSFSIWVISAEFLQLITNHVSFPWMSSTIYGSSPPGATVHADFERFMQGLLFFNFAYSMM